MRHCVPAVFLFFAAALLLTAMAHGEEQLPPPRRILIINSYHAGMPFSDEEVRGLRSALPPATEVFIEYMDTKRLHDPAYMELLAKIYTMKYTFKHFDTVVALDNDAVNFLLKEADRIFPGIPIVFCGVNNPAPNMLDGHEQFTGVIETMDIEASLELGMALYPAAQQILVITDHSTTGVSNRKVLEAVAASGTLPVPLRFLDPGTGLDLTELVKALKKETLPSLIYYADFFQDKHGHALNLTSVIPQVVQAAPGPVMVHSDMYLSNGVLGGKLNSGFRQGVAAAGMVQRIWNGEKPSSIPVMYENINAITLDYQVMKHWQINSEGLAGQEKINFINLPPDPWDGYARYLFIVLLLAMFEGLLILWLLRLLRQQKRLRAQALCSEIRFREVFEMAPVPMCEVLNDGTFIALNRHFITTLGYTLEDIPAVDVWWQKAYPDPEYRHVAMTGWNAAFEATPQHVTPLEFQVTAKDGSVHSMLISATRLDQSVVVSFFDITRRKQSELALQRSEEKFSRIFQLAPECIAFVRTKDFVITDVNAAVEQFCGYTAAEVIGRSTRELYIGLHSPEEIVALRKELEENAILNHEYRYRHRDGSERIGVMSMSRVHLDGEESAVIITHDITQSKHLREMMIHTEKMLSMGGIAAGIAHEINNPLGIIMQSAQTLVQRMRPDFPPNLKAAEQVGLQMDALQQYTTARQLNVFVTDILNAASRAANIIRHMLDFSRRSESQRTLCSLEHIVNRALELASNDYDLKRSFDFKRIRITQTIAPDLPPINCTETEIEQVLLNIFRNAAQAMTRPEVFSPAIDIRISLQQGMVHLEIEDNGPGIPEGIRSRIFEPFFTTKPQGMGTGLGLSVSYFIITQGHDGYLEVRSTESKGTTFLIDLPAWSPQ